jgi:hypothetical protein
MRGKFPSRFSRFNPTTLRKSSNHTAHNRVVDSSMHEHVTSPGGLWRTVTCDPMRKTICFCRVHEGDRNFTSAITLFVRWGVSSERTVFCFGRSS